MARGASGKKKKDPTAVAEVSSKEGEADVEAVVLPKQVSACFFIRSLSNFVCPGERQAGEDHQHDRRPARGGGGGGGGRRGHASLQPRLHRQAR